jgi:putative ABC transport system substrate-binding protein
MKRRTFIGLLGGAASWPLAVRAQKAIPMVGYLNPARPTRLPFAGAFRQGLSDAGYIEGQNLATEYRWAEDHYDRLPALATNLVDRNVDLIAAVGGEAAFAAKSATSTIPILFMAVGDPVGEGLVASLARPGGNITGFSNMLLELMPKRLELLSELVPQAKVIALLVNPNRPGAERAIQVVQEAARMKGLQLAILKAGTEGEIDTAFASLVELHVGALVVAGTFVSQREQFVALASRHAVPAIYIYRDYPPAGGLISYGINNVAAFREAGVYAGKILKGEKPADMPVQRPTKFELVINLKTANALGLTVPLSMLARADEVIE